MKLRYFLVVIILLISAQTYAQTGRQVSGVVKDSTGITLPGTTVKLLTGTDSVSVGTDINGRYTFPSVTVNQFSLVVFSVGYKPLKRRFILSNDNKPAELAPIILKPTAIILKMVKTAIMCMMLIK